MSEKKAMPKNEIPEPRKQREIDYPLKLDKAETEWLYQKPFSYPPIPNTTKHLIDFGYILRLLTLPENAKILDLGVGPGWTSIFLAKTGYKVTGIDISPEMISIARERAEAEGLRINFEIADMESFDLKDKFDGILIYDTLHHCLDIEGVFRCCFKHLNRKGVLLLAEPNYIHNWRGRHAVKRFGTTEKGYSPFYLKRNLRKCGFVKVQRFHNNSKRLYTNSLPDIFLHLAEPWIYRIGLSLFWTQIWLRAEVP